jgi:acyl-CoA thioester hydrolase
MKKTFEIEMKVRDYECDAQGIVNNAIYMHYFENTRHEFMSSVGLSFKESHDRGIDPVVSRADLRYKNSLSGGDIFMSSLNIEREGIKIIFHQCIIRKKDGAVCCTGDVETVVLINGNLSRGDYFDELMKDYL